MGGTNFGLITLRSDSKVIGVGFQRIWTREFCGTCNVDFGVEWWYMQNKQKTTVRYLIPDVNIKQRQSVINLKKVEGCF